MSVDVSTGAAEKMFLQVSPFNCVSLFCVSSIKFMVAQGKEGIIDFTPGSQLLVAKAKNGHLSVVSRLSSTHFRVSILFGFYLGVLANSFSI